LGNNSPRGGLDRGYRSGMRLLDCLKPKPAATSETLVETVLTEAASIRHDADQGVFYGVKIRGRQSKNGHEYDPAVDAQGVRLYEGAEIFPDHPAKGQEHVDRGLLESWGRLKNVTVDPRGGNIGDLHYLKSHPATPQIIERYEKGFPMGLSHNAVGKVVARGGKRIVESLDRVRSVDLVRNAATTTSLTESVAPTMKKTIATIAAAHKATAPDWATLLESVDGDMEVELTEAASDAEQLDGAVGVAVLSILESAKDFAGAKAAVAKAFGLTVPAPPAGAKGGDAGGSGVGDGSKLMESLQTIQATLAGVQKESTISRVLDSHGISRATIGAERVKLLEACTDEAAMTTLIQSWPPAARTARTFPAGGANAGSTTLTEQVGNSREAVLGVLRSR
jgi:hypothetical protein